MQPDGDTLPLFDFRRHADVIFGKSLFPPTTSLIFSYRKSSFVFFFTIFRHHMKSLNLTFGLWKSGSTSNTFVVSNMIIFFLRCLSASLWSVFLIFALHQAVNYH